MGSEWGRIDEAGTVFVKTAEGEREIGSWQAGDAEAGLAFYTRRYDDLATEVTLLEKRLESGAGDPGSTRTHAIALREQLPTVAAIGDLAALDSRLAALLAAVEEKAGANAAAREKARAEAIAAKEALAAEAEQIASTATSWKSSGDRLRAIVDEWKLIKGVDRKTDDALWKRFAAARDAFGRRRGQHFAGLDAERAAAKAAKEKLIERAEALSTSSDWKETASAMRELMVEWKASGRAARDVEDALWTRFRAAQDAFFAHRSEVFSDRDTEQVDNQRTKEAIIAEARGLDISDPSAAQASLRALQARFDEVGHVPREAIRRLDDAMRAAEQRVRDAVDAQWRQASVTSNPFLTALRERLREAEAKLERARKSGDETRIAKAEAEVEQRRSLIPE
jgi:FtsZ-binding cell division protein ZapB